MAEKKTTVHYTPAGWVKAERNHDDFMCRCDDEGKRRCEEVMEFVKGKLDCDKDTLLSSVVFSLSWDFSASITGIYCDQWSGITAQTGDGEFGTFIQCDSVEDGIAATWKAFYDRSPKSFDGEGE